MNKALLTAVTLVSFSAASLAVAGTQAAHQGGMYAGAGFGWGQLLDNEKNLDNQSTVTAYKSNYAARADMGYLFNLSSNLLAGAELGYNYFPQVKVADVKANSYMFDALGVVKYYVMSDVNLFGKGGLAYMHSVAKQTGAKDVKTDAFMPELAMGAGYNITPELEATVTYAHAFGWKSNNPSFNTVLAGLDYHFSM